MRPETSYMQRHPFWFSV